MKEIGGTQGEGEEDWATSLKRDPHSNFRACDVTGVCDAMCLQSLREKQLVKYPTYNPEGTARKGNIFYKQLTMSVDLLLI